VRSLRQFLSASSGNAALIIAAVGLPLTAALAVALDTSGAVTRKQKLQEAADAAALSALRVLLDRDDGAIRKATYESMAANLGHRDFRIVDFKVDRKTYRIELSAKSTYQTALGKSVGMELVPVAAYAVAQGGSETLEVALALDNSGSMNEFGRLEALKEASKSLVQTLMQDKLLQGRVKIGIAPFASSVNIGSQHAGEAWMDVNAVSPIHAENFDGVGVKNRFTLFKSMKNTEWGGCVEARSGGLDVTDALPTTGDPKSLFVPMFAPDEPDYYSAVTNDWYPNNYLSDDGGDCSLTQIGGTEAQRQRRTCKYKNAVPNIKVGAVGVDTGPNFLCGTRPVLPLTDQQGPVVDHIAGMKAKGGTNIVEGAMWGWRLLSPTTPFTEGAPYDKVGHRKIMILMTDGDNNWSGLSAGVNTSIYGAHGFSNRTRIGPSSRSTTTLSKQIDARLRIACENIKAAKIEVYTVSLSPKTETGKALLRDCATTPEMAFTPEKTSELKPVFDEIAASIKRVRLAQ
jgi:hypothetical protein